MKKIIILIILMLGINSFGQKLIEKPPTPVIPINSLELKIQIKEGKKHYSFIVENKKTYNAEYKIIERINNTDTEFDSKDFRRKFGLLFKGKSTGYKRQGFLNEGYKNGLWKTTYKNKLVKTINYKNGLVIGRYRVYNTKGTILYKTTFGAKGNGKFKDYYYKTGVLKQEGNYENGKKEGEWCDYDENGKMKKITIYKDGHPQKKK